MKRKIIVTIETDESGRYCGECQGVEAESILYECRVFNKQLFTDNLINAIRCPACIAAEYTEPFFSGYLRKTKDGVMTISRKEKP